MSGARRSRSASEPPAWAQALDLVVILLIAVGVAVAMTGGLRERIGDGPMVSLRSPWRPWLAALAVVVLRHLLVRTPSLPWRLVDGFRWLGRRLAATAWPAAHLAAVAYFLMSVLAGYDGDTGLTALIQFGDKFDAQALPAVRAVPHFVHHDSWGYDGQFYAQLAVDPWLHDPDLSTALDAPSYRARRMLFAWTAHAAGLGRPAWVLQAYAWQNVVAWLILAALLLAWCPVGSARHFAAWFACLFTTGMLASVGQALTDGPSMTLIAAAVLATERGRTGLAAVLAAVGALGRETNVLAAAVLPPPGDASPRQWLRYAVRAALVAVPLVAWMLYVRSTLGSADTGIQTLDVPFRSFVHKWRVTLALLLAEGWDTGGRASLMTLVSLTVQAIYVVARWRRWRDSAWWRVGLAYAVLMTLAGASVWDGHPGAITRVVLPLTVAFNVLILRERWFWTLWAAGNLAVAADVFGL